MGRGVIWAAYAEAYKDYQCPGCGTRLWERMEIRRWGTTMGSHELSCRKCGGHIAWLEELNPRHKELIDAHADPPYVS